MKFQFHFKINVIINSKLIFHPLFIYTNDKDNIFYPLLKRKIVNRVDLFLKFLN